MAYIYDPSQNIKQEFQQASSGLGNIFTHIIAQQQRDYSLAENTLNNVEALKKNIGIWGTKEVTDGANNLLGQVSSAINKSGKLDYSKLGQVRQEISNLADLKTGYDVFGKQFDRLVQIGAANKENLTSFESFYKNLVSLAADKKLIANPNDLATAMNNVLDDHINTAKMGVTAIKNNLAITPITGMYVDPKTKMEVTYNANVFDGVTVGADGKLIKPTDPVFYQNLAAKIKASDPAAFDAQRKKLSKIGQADIPDADIAKSWFDSMPAGELKPISVKNERQVRAEESDAASAAFKVSKMEDMYNLDRQLKLSGIAENNAQRLKALSEIQKNIPNISDLSAYGINTNAQGKSVDFGAEVEIRASDPSNPNKTVPFKATGLRTLSNGKQELVGYASTGTIDEKTKQLVYGQQVSYYPYSKSATTSLSMAIKNLGKDKEGNIGQSIAIYNGIPVTKPQPKPAPSPTPKPTPKPAPAAATTLSISLMTRKYGEEMVNGRKLKDLSKDEQIEWGKSNIPGAANANFVN